MSLLLFELLQVSLGTCDGLSRTPSTAEWSLLYQEAQKQAILGLLAYGLERLPSNQLPKQDLLLQWIGMTHINEGTYALHCERAKELTSLFNTAGYASCVLKGIGIAQLYPNPEKRMCGDIDFWVTGNRREVMRWMKSKCEIGSIKWHHVDAGFFQDVPVEVHFYPAWLYNPIHNRELLSFFKLKKESQMVARPNGFNYPTPEFDVVFSLVHIFHHLLEEGVGLRHIIDYFYILKVLPIEKRKVSLEIIRHLGLEMFLSAMMWVLKEVCGMNLDCLLCEPNEKEGKFLLNEITSGGNFGKMRSDGLRRNSFGRYRAMVKHYPAEVIWMIPWKVWHKCWRMLYKY